MAKVNCNLCGSDAYAVLFPKEPERGTYQRIVRCRQCGLMYANPQEIVDCDNFLDPNVHHTYDPHGADRQYFQKQHVQLPDYERILPILAGLVPKRGKLLEIGSFIGIFLDRLRKDGWDVTGLEPWPPAIEYSRKTYGLNIVEGILPNPALPKGGFDAVVMTHVIEHMPDPAQSVRHIRELLRPGGVLLVETPRFDSLIFKLIGRRERSINNCPGHIYFFTVPTLSRLLEKNGFEVARVDLVGRTLTIDRLLYNVGLMTRNARAKRWLGQLGNRWGFDRKHVHVNVRDMQRLYCRAK